MTAFQSLVYAATKQIPRGKTRTYKQVAVAIGRPNAFRAVATALAKNTDSRVPCHRVILSSGKLGGYNGLRGTKERVLKKEKAL